MSTPLSGRARWLALIVLCLGSLMIVLDTTIVNVALPSIRTDLGFSASALAWVVNAYMLTFGGFLLLSGRLGDLYGHRRLFLIGIVLFTIASLTCGLSTTQAMLIAARATQGLAAALVNAVALSLLMNLFTEAGERARAIGYFGFVSAGGGSLGVLLGGVLTGINWHWIFLVNIPIGVLVVALSLWLLPKAAVIEAGRHLDVAGALTITLAMMCAVYAIVNGNEAGWTSVQTVGLLVSAFALLAVFVGIESKVKVPLMRLSLFKSRTITVSNLIGMLSAAGMFAWFFLSALYLQTILKFEPLTVGLSFLPANVIMAIFSVGLSAKAVMRFGIRACIAAGMSLITIGLLLFAIAPEQGNFWIHVLPNMIVLGLGAGLGFNPIFLAAMNDVKQSESGLASGLVNTAFMMGGALGLAVLASLAAAQTNTVLAQGASLTEATLRGYHAAFFVGALFTAAAAVLGATLLQPKSATSQSSN